MLKNFLSINIERYPQLTDSYSNKYKRKVNKNFIVGIFGVKAMIDEGVFDDIVKNF